MPLLSLASIILTAPSLIWEEFAITTPFDAAVGEGVADAVGEGVAVAVGEGVAVAVGEGVADAVGEGVAIGTGAPFFHINLPLDLIQRYEYPRNTIFWPTSVHFKVGPVAATASPPMTAITEPIKMCSAFRRIKLTRLL